MREVFPRMMPRQHLSPERRRLAAILKEMREETGLSAEAFGEQHGWSQGKVSKSETGRTVPPAEDVVKWAAAAGHPERAAELAALTESLSVQTRSYAGHRGPTLAARAEQAGELESLSTVVRVFQCAEVPGLLQTPDYARSLMEMLGRPEEEIPPAVNARMQRQDALYRLGRRFEFILTEGALRWRPGSPQMMSTQYDRLLRVAAAPAAELRVLPFAIQAPAFYDSPFMIFEIPDDPTVLAEGTPSEHWYHGDDEIELCRATFARCWDAALAGDDAFRFIEGIQRTLHAD